MRKLRSPRPGQHPKPPSGSGRAFERLFGVIVPSASLFAKISGVVCSGSVVFSSCHCFLGQRASLSLRIKHSLKLRCWVYEVFANSLSVWSRWFCAQTGLGSLFPPQPGPTNSQAPYRGQCNLPTFLAVNVLFVDGAKH